MKINNNQKLFAELLISLLEQMYENHNNTLSELCDPIRNINKESILNEIAKIMLEYNIKDSNMEISKAQQMKLYNELCIKINEMFSNEFDAEKECISNILESAAKDSYYINSFVTSIGIDYTLKPVSDKVLQEIINHKIDDKTWSDFLWNDKVELRKDLKLQAKKFLNGEINVNKISDIIQAKYKNNKYVTDRLVNDNIAHVQEEANKVWKENHNITTDLYMGTLDYKICDKCKPYDGKTFNINEGPQPPIHVGCRCTRVAIINENWRPSQRIDNETKQRIPWQDYENWHKNYVENNPTRLAEEKKYKNRFSDKKQYEKYKEILGEKVPKTFDKFQELKYNNTNEWELFKDYSKSRSNNMISAFTSFEDYKMYKYKVEKELVGLITSNGIKITGQSKHFLERIFGTSEDPKTKRPREGVEIEDIKDALLNGTIRIRKTDPNSIKFVTDKCMVSINPNTGNLIQANP